MSIEQWTYDETQVTEIEFETIPVGDHRVRINNVEPTKSKSGNDMLKLTFDVSNHSGKLFHYLVFLPDQPQITNTKLHAIYSSFGIKPGEQDLTKWLNQAGACHVKHEMYNNNSTAKISYFIKKENQKNLPEWVEKSSNNNKQQSFNNDDIPF